MVEQNPQVAKALKENCARLEATEITVRMESARDFLKGVPEPFDLVFLDPPFRKGWLASAASVLERGGWLAPDAFLYLEAEREFDFAGLPVHWHLLRQGTAGDVAYRLYQRQQRDPE